MSLYQIILFLLSFIIVEIFTDNLVKFGKLLNENLNAIESIGLYNCETLFCCLLMCSKVSHCFLAGFDEICQCSLYELNFTVVDGTGQNLYVKITDTTEASDLMTGATAWQSGTYYGQFAGRALDGDFAQDYYSCANTGYDANAYTYWAMEFGTAGIVTSVDIYLRSDYGGRSTNRSVLISQTREDAINNIGTMCGGYFGPLIDFPPFIMRIQCTRPTYGKCLKITYEYLGDTQICEVVVHSP